MSDQAEQSTPEPTARYSGVCPRCNQGVTVALFVPPSGWLFPPAMRFTHACEIPVQEVELRWTGPNA